MPMTRHSGRSSFTFEIKRTPRPSPEILSRRKTSFPAFSSLADQVFGTFSGPSTAPSFDGSQGSASDRSQVGLGSLGVISRERGEGTEALKKASPQRVLPDLLSVLPDPVEERLREEAEERAARRRAARQARVVTGEGASIRSASANKEMQPVQRATMDSGSSMLAKGRPSTPEPLLRGPEQSPALLAPTRVQSKGAANMKEAARRAQKKGLQAPRLPPGERWKRRLPWMCW